MPFLRLPHIQERLSSYTAFVERPGRLSPLFQAAAPADLDAYRTLSEKSYQSREIATDVVADQERAQCLGWANRRVRRKYGVFFGARADALQAAARCK